MEWLREYENLIKLDVAGEHYHSAGYISTTPVQDETEQAKEQIKANRQWFRELVRKIKPEKAFFGCCRYSTPYACGLEYRSLIEYGVFIKNNYMYVYALYKKWKQPALDGNRLAPIHYVVPSKPYLVTKLKVKSVEEERVGFEDDYELFITIKTAKNGEFLFEDCEIIS